MIDFIKRRAKRIGIAVTRFITCLEIAPRKYYDCHSRYGKANKHNALVPHDFWLKDWEKQAIINFYLGSLQEGYRRLGACPRIDILSKIEAFSKNEHSYLVDITSIVF
ncbi:hypothetical protein JWG39_12070 [Desulforhopalus vacuolatus]|uniref:hypothetical protein n=1 Tax=Desulforhopalus vacuolatus TaxID=40414 RepID=UPI00196537CC|nr:hypothetical protein [Desulforhopalus vacuolatus]MBM9520552.1 hypothetical protein [Desulforhopalus vacuolatus]